MYVFVIYKVYKCKLSFLFRPKSEDVNRLASMGSRMTVHSNGSDNIRVVNVNAGAAAAKTSVVDQRAQVKFCIFTNPVCLLIVKQSNMVKMK